jgi:hypothetical protein
LADLDIIPPSTPASQAIKKEKFVGADRYNTEYPVARAVDGKNPDILGPIH